MLRKYVLFMGLLSCIQNTVFAGSSVVACYFNNWGIYRQGLGQFKVENIDPELCTHIFYAFEGVREDGIIVHVDEWADVNLNEIEDIIALKKSYPDLKVLVSIGGYGPLSAAFSQVMKETTARTNLINSSLAFIQKYGFDGLDIVWEFPTSLDKENFASFIQEIRCTFKDQNLLVTAAVSFTGNTYEDIYDVPVLSENLDMISLLENDFHGNWENYTGSNAPLYASPADTRDNTMNVDVSVRHWISQGANPQKLLLGIPFYGKSFSLDDPKTTGLRSPAGGLPPMRPYTQEIGVLGYNEICELQKEGGWTIIWEDYQKVPYMFKGKTWISYDNVESIQTKGLSWRCNDGIKQGINVKQAAIAMLTTVFEGLRTDLTKLNSEKLSNATVKAAEAPINYARVVKNNTQPAVLVNPENESQSNEATKLALLENIDPVASNLKQTKVRPVNHGGIVVGCKNPEGNRRFGELTE